MRSVTCLGSLMLLVFSSACFAAEPVTTPDIRQAVPAEAYLAIYGRHNPERDYQAEYLKEVWQTVEDEKLLERALEIVTSRMEQEDVDGAQSVLDELRAAVEPIDWQAVANCPEIVYTQTMVVPTTQHLVLIRLTPDAAASCESALGNLFALIEKYSEGNVPVVTDKEGDVLLTTLGLPKDVPFQPVFARVGDVLVLSSSQTLARQSLNMLLKGGSDSKFNDPRLAHALTKLPEPEDTLVFFDGQQLFKQLRGLGPFIRQVSQNDPEAARAAQLIEMIMDEVAVIDYQVSVEYTDGNRNCTMEYGKVTPDIDKKVLGKMFASGKPFDNWQRWIPADAIAYSLCTGADLHPLYEWAMETIPSVFPEAQEGLDAFEQMQVELGVHLDRDLFQAFSGENVSVSLPAASPSQLGGHDSVLALRCRKPERIRELLQTWIDRLAEIPALRDQKLKLIPCDDLEDFEELSTPMLAMVGARPVIGFHDGWMFIGSTTDAAQKVLDTLAGKGDAIDDDAYQRFGLKIEGPVDAISYTNLAESTRQTAQFIRQAGAIAPMILGIVGAQAESEELELVQEILGLLPSVAKVVDKFDYLEEKLSVTQTGNDPTTHLKRTVTLVRQPEEDKPE